MSHPAVHLAPTSPVPLHDASWALFDLDGCLIDSSRAIPAGINAGLASVGVPTVPPEDLQWCMGPPLFGSMQTLLAVHDIHDRDTIEAAIAGYREVYPAMSLELTSVQPGILDLLAGIGQRRAIVTSKPAAYARPLAEAMGLMAHMEELFGPEAAVETEPKEVTLRRALATLDIADPATAVMVGDRHHDVDAGIALGTRTVGVTWGGGDREELVDAGADHVVDAAAELRTLLAEAA